MTTPSLSLQPCYTGEMRNGIVLIAFLWLCAGCANDADIYAVVQDRAYTPSEFLHAANGKTLPTRIQGNPFDVPETELRRHVLGAMQPANWWYSQAFTPRVQFASLENRQSPPNYHIAVLFGTDDVPAELRCTVTEQPVSQPDDAIVARLSFCRGTTLLSTSRGELSSAQGPEDLAFRRMITRMTMALFPQRRDRETCGPLRNRRGC